MIFKVNSLKLFYLVSQFSWWSIYSADWVGCTCAWTKIKQDSKTIYFQINNSEKFLLVGTTWAPNGNTYCAVLVCPSVLGTPVLHEGEHPLCTSFTATISFGWQTRKHVCGEYLRVPVELLLNETDSVATITSWKSNDRIHCDQLHTFQVIKSKLKTGEERSFRVLPTAHDC